MFTQKDEKSRLFAKIKKIKNSQTTSPSFFSDACTSEKVGNQLIANTGAECLAERKTNTWRNNGRI